MARTNRHEVIPSAKRLIRSLRDMGYDFSTAVADLVDNSIEAGSTHVFINVEFNGDNSWVRIADNGIGMGVEQLQEAMRYGSERVYDSEKDLGKFGLGLKTASMSQCQRLIVASRSDLNLKEIHAYCWDMDHINTTNKWEIIQVSKKELKFILNSNLDTSTGTVVFWQKLDRILGYKHPYGDFAKKRLLNMCRDLEEHLAMVFHRFLAGEVPGKRLKIILNGNNIEPWDPYSRQELKTQILDPIPIHLEHEGKTGIITLEPYVLPHQDDFSSRDSFNRASGPKKWNRQQGFYIYRANRLIQSGGWCGLKTIDEHLKLARIAISFSPHLDEAFKINVSKMNVQLPVQIRDQMDNATKPVAKLAQETYRKSAQKIVDTITAIYDPPLNNARSTQHSIAQPKPETQQHTSFSPNSKPNTPTNRYWTLDEIQTKLEILADQEEKPVLVKVFNRLRNNLNSQEDLS